MSEHEGTRLATLGEIALTADGLCRWLREYRRLGPLLRAAAVEEFLMLRAKEAGISVSDAELQQAADRFRQRHGLTVEGTPEWLAREGNSVADLEAGLVSALVLEKYKFHLLATTGEAHFREHREALARVRLRRLIVATEGLAREILTQVREEGRSFEELAAARSPDPAAGDMGEVFRGQLPAPVAEVVFAAQPGDVVGPFHTQRGFELYQVGPQRAAQWDEPTIAAVREEIFAAWVRDRMAEVQLYTAGSTTP